MASRTPRALDSEFADGAAVLRWIDQRTSWRKQQQFNAIDLVWQTRAYDAHDVGLTPGFGGDTSAALASIRAKTLVLAPPVDLFNPADAGRNAAAAISGARFVEIPSDMGHQAATATKAEDAAFLNRIIKDFLQN